MINKLLVCLKKDVQFSKYNIDLETPFAIFEVFESKNADVSYTNDYQNKVTCRYDWKLHAFMKNIVNKCKSLKVLMQLTSFIKITERS